MNPFESPYRPVFGFSDGMKKSVGGEKSMFACLVQICARNLSGVV